VLIAGLPAATVTTPHICSFPPPAVHPPSAIMPPGCPTVLIGGMPAARLSDGCGLDVILLGSMTVLIGGLPAARIGDPTGAGGMVSAPGCPTVLIGG